MRTDLELLKGSIDIHVHSAPDLGEHEIRTMFHDTAEQLVYE